MDTYASWMREWRDLQANPPRCEDDPRLILAIPYLDRLQELGAMGETLGVDGSINRMHRIIRRRWRHERNSRGKHTQRARGG